jgi:hypothetical protein
MQFVALLFLFGMIMFAMSGRDNLGSLYAAMNIVVVGTPLTVFYTVILKKDLGPLGSLEMSLATWFSSLVWLILGIVYIQKIQIWLPSAFGLTVSTCCFILFGTIGRKKMKKKWRKWVSARTGTKNDVLSKSTSGLGKLMFDDMEAGTAGRLEGGIHGAHNIKAIYNIMNRFENDESRDSIVTKTPGERITMQTMVGGEPLPGRLSYKSQKRKLLLEGAGSGMGDEMDTTGDPMNADIRFGKAPAYDTFGEEDIIPRSVTTATDRHWNDSDISAGRKKNAYADRLSRVSGVSVSSRGSVESGDSDVSLRTAGR